ncbi:MAG: acylphosphatase [Thermomonas sp.]|uniref:acylphosphatase n=1 Tax=Thermomonas sp. TaxID=1971895 RepID=UPI001B750807|nr:acylphosphatase [Thermomonas sp.]MBP8647146.1 acylphosphatase [Thermomonas sp.]MBP9696495.1 acylphosphatase [Thermomonas sp.]
MAAVRFLVRGKVQGVWFRASTRAEALALGLRGHARNLADGGVEVVATGDAAAIERLAAWLRHGPPTARVDTLQRFDADAVDAAPEGFGVR